MEGRIHAPAGIAKIAAFLPTDKVVQNVVNQIFDFMVQYGVEKEPLGIDGTTLSYIYAEAFKAKGIEVVHAKPFFDQARMIKTKDEIEHMRAAGGDNHHDLGLFSVGPTAPSGVDLDAWPPVLE